MPEVFEIHDARDGQDHEEISTEKKKIVKDGPPSGWRPSLDTIQAIEGDDSITTEPKPVQKSQESQ